MQITQGTSLDTLQLLSSKEAISTFKIGQVLKAQVIQGTPQHQGGGQAVLEIAGKQMEVRALLALKTGDSVQVQLDKNGDTLLLKPVQTSVKSEPVFKSLLLQALPKQASLQAVFLQAQNLLNKPPVNLPPDIQNQLQKLLNILPSKEKLFQTQSLMQTLSTSGIFLESNLKQSLKKPLLEQDIKAQLNRLLALLKPLLVDPKLSQTSQRERSQFQTNSNIPVIRNTVHHEQNPQKLEQSLTPLPPQISLTPTVQLPLQITNTPSSENWVEQLFTAAEQALARIHTKQIHTAQNTSETGTTLPVDIAFTSQLGLHILDLIIQHKHAGQHEDQATGAAASSLIEFAILLPQSGPVRFSLEITPSQTLNLCLLCERPEAKVYFENQIMNLQSRLSELGFIMGNFRIQSGSLSEEAVSAQANAHLLDVQA